MKKFFFNLQRLLEIRQLREKIALQGYQQALLQLRQLRREFDENDKLIVAVWKKRPQINLRVTPGELLLTENYLLQLQAKKQNLHEQIKEQLRVVQERLEIYQQKHREALLLEKIRQKKWQQYLVEADRQEQKVQDELFLAKINRERR